MLDLPRQPAKSTISHQQLMTMMMMMEMTIMIVMMTISMTVIMPIAVTMMMEMMFSIVAVTHFLPEAIRLAARSGSSSTSRLTSLGAVVSTAVKS